MSTSNQKTPTVESWEQREAQIREERAAEFSKLTPEEQQKILTAEKTRFQEARSKLKTDLGYGGFDPAGQKKAEAANRKAEEEAHQREIENEEKKLRESQGAGEHREQQATPELTRFLVLFDAAVQNIEQKKPFEFESVALDDFARPVRQHALMRQMFDHSQKDSLSPADIRKRLEKGTAKPVQISVTVEIDMGESKNNSLGLTNLGLRLSLASLIDGHFSEKLSRFTNLALYASVLHDRQKNAEPPKATRDQAVPPREEGRFQKEREKFAITQLAENGGLLGADKAFETGATNTVAFSFNNGSVWGTFDTHGAPVNPKELQESIDKTNKET